MPSFVDSSIATDRRTSQAVSAGPVGETHPRIVFFGYSEVGFECLSLLLERGDNVVALITHEDNPNEKIWFKTPAVAARERGIPVHTPETVNTPEWREKIAALRPDLILSVYYRNMIGTKILAMPRLGAFNLHGSLLPRFRGRAPINWAVLHGEPRIGMTLHRMVKEPDAGAIVDQEGVDIGPRDTAEQAFRKVLPCARAVVARQIDALLAGTARETPQDESQATYFGGRRPEDGRIDWRQTSRQLFNLIRAVTDPYPGAFADVSNKLIHSRRNDVSETPNAADDTSAADPVPSVSAQPLRIGTAGAAAPAARLMVWWAEVEADSPAARDALSRWTPPAKPAPGTVLSVSPLVVATGDGALELTRTEWRGALPPTLRVGDRFAPAGE